MLSNISKGALMLNRAVKAGTRVDMVRYRPNSARVAWGYTNASNRTLIIFNGAAFLAPHAEGNPYSVSALAENPATLTVLAATARDAGTYESKDLNDASDLRIATSELIVIGK